MKNVLVRMLVVCFTAASFQAQAGLIRTGEAAGALAQAQEARTLLAAKLHAFGVSKDMARERIGALTDAEAMKLAGQVDQAPAGADPITFGMLAVVVFLFWRFVLSDQAKAEAAARDKASAPPAK